MALPQLPDFNIQDLVNRVKQAKSILLTTHRQCDGDGLGAQLALYHGLKKIGKDVRILNVDETPQKYGFLNPHLYIEHFNQPHTPVGPTDLALVFDTNDHRLVEPLFSHLKKWCREILFIDHHPILKEGPEPTPGSFINTSAASTGEIAYYILHYLNVALDDKQARALYTSIVFDTQLFKYIRNSPSSHLICADLLQYEKDPFFVHRQLFANFTVKKLSFLAKALARIEYLFDEKIAIVKISSQDLVDHEMDADDSRDFIDMVMNIESLIAAALFREDGPNQFKLSLRSKGAIEVASIAESLGGGGHLHAAGAHLNGNYDDHRRKVVELLHKKIEDRKHDKKQQKQSGPKTGKKA